MHYIMMQYSLCAGLKKFSEQGEAAIAKELTQIYVLDTFKSIDTSKMTAE